MIEQLFGSKTRVKLLQLFYANPNRSFYVREITRKIDEQINSVRRELSNLLGIGIITSETNNNRLYYEVNQDYEYYQPLSMVFGGEKPASEPTAKESKTAKTAKKAKDPDQVAEIQETTKRSGLDDPMIKMLRSCGKIDLAFLSGQFTREDRAEVDMLLVGDINQTKTTKVMAELEEKERKVINYAVLTTDDFKYRLQVHDRFLHTLLSFKKQVLINDANLETEA